MGHKISSPGSISDWAENLRQLELSFQSMVRVDVRQHTGMSQKQSQTRLKIVASKVEGADNIGVDESQAQHRFDVLSLLLKLDSRGLPLNYLHWRSSD